MVGLAGAVDAFARGGLVARELTPDAILVDRRRGAILTDYGMPPGLVGPTTGRRDANAAYRSPEERDGRELTARSSVYSLGAILVTALTAARPPEQLRPQQARRTRDVPATIESVIAQAMARDPRRRYATVTEMARAAVEVLRAGERIGRMEAPRVHKEKPLRAVPWSAAQKRGSGRPKLVVPATVLEDAEAATRRKRGEAAQRKAAQEAERREQAAEAAKRKREQAAAKRERDAATKRAREQAAAKQAREQAAAKRKRAQAAGKRKAAAKRAREQAAAKRKAAAKRAREQAAAKRKREQEARRKAGAAAKRNSASTTRRRGASESGRQRKPRRGTAEKRSASVAAPSVRATARIPKPRIDLGAVRASLGRHRRPVVGTALAAVVAGAAVASTLALMAGGGGGEGKAIRISAADLSIRMPAGWEQGAPQIAGLDWLSGMIGGTASDERNAALVTGLIREPGAARRGLRALLPDGASGKTVRLGRLEAKRYSNLRLGSGMAGTVYVVPTTGPSLAVVCRTSTPTANAFARQCAEAASTVRLRGERALSPAIAAHRPLLVRWALRTLSAERAEGRRRVAAALVADDQAKAARGLQATYLQAAGRVDLSGAYGQRIEALSAALHEASYGYGALVQSINAGDQRAYDAARAVVLEAETQVWGKSAAN